MSNMLPEGSLAVSSLKLRENAAQEEMDRLRRTRTSLAHPEQKAEKLKQACEGFESLFIQKLWQQMRKTVPKEGYLHSKYEEQYVSMFDEEMSKKMASAGGIGLGEVLYRNLSQSLLDASRTTNPSGVAEPLPLRALGQPQQTKPVKEIVKEPAPETEPEVQAAPSFDEREEALYGSYDETGTEAENVTTTSFPGEDPYAAEEMVLKPSDVVEEVGHDAPASPAFGAQASPAAETPATKAELSARIEALARAIERSGGAAGSEGGPAPRIVDGTSGLGTYVPGRGVISNGPAMRELLERIDASGPLDLDALHDLDALSETPRIGEYHTGDGTMPALWTPVAGSGAGFGRVSSEFGWRRDPFTGERAWHSGVDLVAPEGTDVAACWDGRVVYSGERGGYGNLVVLEHEGGWRSYYGHNKQNEVAVGDQVAAGKKIAEIGSTGRSTGAHLHFELRQGDTAYDPRQVRQRILAGLPVGGRRNS